MNATIDGGLYASNINCSVFILAGDDDFVVCYLSWEGNFKHCSLIEIVFPDRTNG